MRSQNFITDITPISIVLVNRPTNTKSNHPKNQDGFPTGVQRLQCQEEADEKGQVHQEVQDRGG